MVELYTRSHFTTHVLFHNSGAKEAMQRQKDKQAINRKENIGFRVVQLLQCESLISALFNLKFQGARKGPWVTTAF